MLHITLTDHDRAALQRLRRDPILAPLERDHVEMVLLAASGWSAPRIATHLGRCAATVRTLLKRFPQEGLPSLRCRRPGPPPDAARRTQVTTALEQLLDQPRTWTARQLSAALADQEIALSPRQTRKYLRDSAAWRRTVRTLAHRQDPVRVARATPQLAVLNRRRRRASSRSVTSMSAASAPASR
jgi:transposase